MAKDASPFNPQIELMLAAARKGRPIDPAIVLRDLLSADLSVKLAEHIAATHPLHYQESRKNPGCLEQIDTAGVVQIGHFMDGQFHQIE
jgi:hypothetical protein